MKYEEKTFSVAVGSDEYRRGFDRIFKTPTPTASAKVWLLCWCSWDYDFHEDAREAFTSEAKARAAAARHGGGFFKNRGREEGWSIVAVELDPESPA